MDYFPYIILVTPSYLDHCSVDLDETALNRRVGHRKKLS